MESHKLIMKSNDSFKVRFVASEDIVDVQRLGDSVIVPICSSEEAVLGEEDG